MWSTRAKPVEMKYKNSAVAGKIAENNKGVDLRHEQGYYSRCLPSGFLRHVGR
jgi:hypothetical protein